MSNNNQKQRSIETFCANIMCGLTIGLMLLSAILLGFTIGDVISSR